MKVIIMCGGKGTRLREETVIKPKPMVEIGGRPVLWHIMNIYARFGFKDFILPLGYKGEYIKQYFHDYNIRNTDFTVDLKNGDITEIPRAMNATAANSATYNSLANDRYVEKGDFVRLQYLQLTYRFDPGKLKRFGINRLNLAASANNLWFWTRYKGVDPEHSQSGYSPCIDNSETPRSRSFTVSLNIGF